MSSTRPIPAFYCCYLLRSTTKPTAAPYIGSTPHLLRRWKQHNGLVAGGAARTSRASYRPWQPLCIVHGFPSQVAALQFEWAWQHASETRHMKKGESMGEKASKGRMTVAKKLADLHMLLRTKSFERWPLGVRFLEKETWRQWSMWDQRSSAQIRKGIRVVLDPLAEDNSDKRSSKITSPPYPVPPALLEMDFGYLGLRTYLQKSTALLSASSDPACDVCKSHVSSNHAALVCPHEGCSAVSHVDCLSHHFRSARNELDEVVPTGGYCPSCKQESDWVTLTRELSLRTRSPELVAKILKPQRRVRNAQGVLVNPSTLLEDGAVDDADETAEQQMEDEELSEIIHEQLQQADEDDGFIDIDDFVDQSSDSEGLPPSAQISQSKWSSPAKRVVPDSDWDNVEVI